MPKKKSVYEIKDDHLHKRVGVELKRREKLLKSEAKDRKERAAKRTASRERLNAKVDRERLREREDMTRTAKVREKSGADKPKRSHAAITPGVDRRRRADNPRTGQRYVSAEAKQAILDFIGPQSVTAKQVATATGLSLTLVHQVMKHHPGIFVDKKATVAPREVDHNGREAAGPRPVRYMLGKVALRQYEARRALPLVDDTERLSRTEPSEHPVGGPVDWSGGPAHAVHPEDPVLQ